jgi:VIT1/CCC1 family predicted Fe2+/Mn2+ transporter
LSPTPAVIVSPSPSATFVPLLPRARSSSSSGFPLSVAIVGLAIIVVGVVRLTYVFRA